MSLRKVFISLLGLGALYLFLNWFNIAVAQQEAVWTDEFISYNSRWDWNYNAGTGYKRLATIDEVSVVEIGITKQSSSSSYSDCSLHERGWPYTHGGVEARLRLTDDNGINQPGQGSRGWGFWNNEDPSNVDAAWFFSLSPESDASVAGFQAMVIRDSTIVFQKFLTEIDMREWHTYRVELSDTGTRFFVDDIEVAFTSQRPDEPQRIEIWIDNYIVQRVNNRLQPTGYLNVEQDQRVYIDWIRYYDHTNQPPALDPIGDREVNQNELLTFTVTATDPDGDSLTFAVSNLPSGATFDPTIQQFTWTPAYDQVGVYPNVLFTVTDDGNPPLTDSDTITITVGDVNDPPTAVDDSAYTQENTTIEIDVLSNDYDTDGTLDPTSVSITAGPSKGSISVNYMNDTITYIPNLNYRGFDSFSYTVADDEGAISNEAAVTISVEGELIEFAETGVISGVNNLDWKTVGLDRTFDSMVVVCTPNYDSATAPLVVRVRNAAGNSFEVRVDRADGLTDEVAGIDVHYMVVEEGVYIEAIHGIKMEAGKFTSTVTDSNSSWVGEELAYNNSYNNPVVLGQVTTYNDPGFSVFWSRGRWRSNPPSTPAFWVGKHVGEDYDTTRENEIIGYIVIEAGSGTIGTTRYLAGLGADTVGGVGNSPPYRYSFGVLPSVSTAIISQAAMDGNDGSWAVLYGSNPVTNTTLNLAIDEDQLGDSERSHTTEQVAYIVFGPARGNMPPVAQDQSVNIYEDTSVDITLTASDADEDFLTYSVVTSPSNGSLSGTAPNLTYTPNSDYNAPDSFTFIANDGLVDSNVATVSITVTGVNDAPVAYNDAYSFQGEDSFTIIAPGVLGNDSDVDGDTLTAMMAVEPSHGTLQLNANGSFIYMPYPEFTGTDSFTYTANDGKANSNAAMVTITVESSFPSNKVMYLSSIEVTKQSWWFLRYGRARVQIVDADGSPVEGVTIEGEWSGGATDTDHFTTGSDGWGATYSNWSWADARFTFCVKGVSKEGEYVPDPSVFTCGNTN